MTFSRLKIENQPEILSEKFAAVIVVSFSGLCPHAESIEPHRRSFHFNPSVEIQM